MAPKTKPQQSNMQSSSDRSTFSYIAMAMAGAMLSNFAVVPSQKLLSTLAQRPAVQQVLAARPNIPGLWASPSETASADPAAPTVFTPRINSTCAQPQYTVRIVSYEPFIAHVENFIDVSERQYLIDLADTIKAPSTVKDPNGTEYLDWRRTSSTAYLPVHDEVVNCVAHRASEFQGFMPRDDIDVQVTSYQIGQEYQAHYDWVDTPNPAERGTHDRESTFFGILDCDCTNCGTRFTELPASWNEEDPRWCEFVECGDDRLTVKAVPGSAVFWRNLHADGSGDRRTLHAGLPIPAGFKHGLNIWTKIPVPQAQAPPPVAPPVEMPVEQQQQQVPVQEEPVVQEQPPVQQEQQQQVPVQA